MVLQVHVSDIVVAASLEYIIPMPFKKPMDNYYYDRPSFFPLPLSIMLYSRSHM